MNDGIWRFPAAICGAGLLAAAAHAVIVAMPAGYGSADAWLTLAIACGTAVTALLVGSVWSAGRRSVALLLVLAVVAGEGFQLLRTSERLIASRERAAAPMRTAALTRTALEVRVDAARLELKRLASGTTPELTEAKAAKAAAAKAVRVSASLRGCARNCRRLLQDQSNAAAADVAAARAAIEARRGVLQKALTVARLELEGLPVAISPAPLADRLGLPAWTLDLLISALGSIGAVGLGVALLAAAGHVVPSQDGRPAKPSRIASVDNADALAADDQIRLWAVDQLGPKRGHFLTVSEAVFAYNANAVTDGRPVLPSKLVSDGLAAILAAADVRLEMRAGSPGWAGIALEGAEADLAALENGSKTARFSDHMAA